MSGSILPGASSQGQPSIANLKLHVVDATKTNVCLICQFLFVNSGCLFFSAVHASYEILPSSAALTPPCVDYP